MRRERGDGIFFNLDWFTVILFLLLVLMGWANIYAACYDDQHTSIFDVGERYGKQMIFVAAAVVIGLALLIIDASFYTATAYILYGITIALNVAVIFLGKDVKGSHSWFKFGEFGIQPEEFAKFGVALALAKLISDAGNKLGDRRSSRPFRDFFSFLFYLLTGRIFRAINEFDNFSRTLFFSFLIIAVPAAVILLQNETGGALVLAVFTIVLYREGLLPGWLFAIGFLIAAVVIISLKYSLWPVFLGLVILSAILVFFIQRRFVNFIILAVGMAMLLGIGWGSSKALNKMQPHQQNRIKVWLGLPLDTNKKRSDSLEKVYNYNVMQSTIAIGSGGMSGKGYLQGTQTKYDFVPEQETDFIFCTVGEEWGFIGTSTVVLLYFTLILRLIILSERQRSAFSRIYGYGVAAVFFLHLIINVGMTIGLVPVIGIPLPFFSYGGSSLWGFTVLLFIFLKLDSQRLLILR